MRCRGYLTGVSAEDIEPGRGLAEGIREPAEDSPRTVAIRFKLSKRQVIARKKAIAFCQTVGARVTRTQGNARAVPYSSNQQLAAG